MEKRKSRIFIEIEKINWRTPEGEEKAVRQNSPSGKTEKHMKNLIQGIVIILIGVATIAGILWMANWGMNRQERFECKNWQAEAGDYPGYYITEWQQQQCDRWGIQIDAKVVK